jgi:tol-pal system protein YbgF
MRKLGKFLAVGGLAVCAGPLSLGAWSQGYVDVEAERASSIKTPDTSSGSTSAPQPAQAPVSKAPDPYRAAPATAYPTTSYGLDSSAATTAAQPPPSAPPPINTSGDQNLGNLFYQLQLLQQEVMMLNGKVEEQAHELRRLREQNLERYVDVDRRLGELGSGVVVPPAGASGGAVAGLPSGGSAAASSTAELPGEGEAYRAAYGLVRTQQFDQAVSSFKQFLRDYPAGKYAPNAHYWLGELYLVIEPVDLESSRQAFMLLVDLYPDNSKIPDALYKLGKVQYMKGNRDKAREFFDRVIKDYGSTNSSAVNLARDFLRENY